MELENIEKSVPEFVANINKLKAHFGKSSTIIKYRIFMGYCMPLYRCTLSVSEKGAYLFLCQFPRCRHHHCIMVSLEYLPYYWKVFNHIWEFSTLGMGKFFHMLKFDL